MVEKRIHGKRVGSQHTHATASQKGELFWRVKDGGRKKVEKSGNMFIPNVIYEEYIGEKTGKIRYFPAGSSAYSRTEIDRLTEVLPTMKRSYHKRRHRD